MDQPASVLLQKAGQRILPKIKHPGKNVFSTSINPGYFEHIIDLKKITTNPYNKELSEFLYTNYLNHRLDILGSGWVDTGYHAVPLGVESFKYESPLKNIEFDNDANWLSSCISEKNIADSKKRINIIRQINSEYQFIDWQRDIKSGFRYNAQIPGTENIKLTPYSKGADLKVARELSRMHHFVQMALVAYFDKNKREELIKEFICQSLDFIALNPIGMGVQWLTSMDVALRAVNWVVALDIFVQLDEKGLIDEEIKKDLQNYLFNHLEFVNQHREYRAGHTNNHYLANVAGMAIVSSYFTKVRQGKIFFDFSVKELEKEVFKQFFDDGGNFEGSTCYHVLATELVLWASAFILHHKSNIFSKEYLSRISNAFHLWKLLEKPDGKMPQIGDNDSGRTLRISLSGTLIKAKQAEEKYLNLKGYSELYGKESTLFDENQIDYSALLSGFSALWGDKNQSAENQLISAVIGGNILPHSENDTKFLLKDNFRNKYRPLQHVQINTISFPQEIDTEKINGYYYPEAGYFIYKSDEFYLLISACTNSKAFSNWGHFHNDKLSFELQVLGKNLTLDKGAYLYTPSMTRRNEFRNTAAHNTIQVNDMQQNRFYEGKFWDFNLMRDSKCKLLQADNNCVVFENKYRGIHHIRKWIVEKNQLMIEDSCNHKFDVSLEPKGLFSNGYGKLTYIEK